MTGSSCVVLFMGRALYLVLYGFGTPIVLCVCVSRQYPMDLDAAKQKFLDLVNGVDASQVKEFFAWIKESFAFGTYLFRIRSSRHHSQNSAVSDKNDESEEGDVVMHQIVQDLRQVVPTSAVFPSERCLFPEYGVVGQCSDVEQEDEKVLACCSSLTGL